MTGIRWATQSELGHWTRHLSYSYSLSLALIQGQKYGEPSKNLTHEQWFVNLVYKPLNHVRCPHIHPISSEATLYVLEKSSFIFKIFKLATVVEGGPKAPFSIATTPRCQGVWYSIPWIAPLYPWSIPYNAVLSKAASSIILKVFGITQSGIEPQFPRTTLPIKPTAWLLFT